MVPNTTNQFDTLLEKHFHTVESIILSRQDPITGLLPASTAINAHGDYTDAWVRDNVYSILAAWGLAISYKKYDPSHYRTHLLSQSVVKLMRGLLGAMMRQSDRVESFKNSLNPIDALHAKYSTKSGLAVVGDSEWGHLQLDATSLFLLMTAQMTASGLRLIYTLDEVNFIQNLVHYISRTYCTPDYGIWERGNKTNLGATEINSSSVGMAKAALEAMNGFNLFGNVVGNEAVIHVVPSDIARTRFTLQGLLPRESNSKETDAALLSIIGYPAYAIEDEKLVKRTRQKVIKKLAGRYGCKRFLLDGHQSSIEDPHRLHYEPSELRAFAHIESEWPLFFTYLLLDALMREDSEAIKEWRSRLEPLFVEQNGELLLPELYIVPHESIEAERKNPGTQQRIPNENIPLVWAQSLYMLSDMILDGLLRPADIDPLRRHERIGLKRKTHPLVCVLVEDESLKQELLDLGFESETLAQVAPIKLMHAVQLSHIHTAIGKNEKLSLSGRPFLVARAMTTSRLHIISGEEILFLPYYFNPLDFYLSYDNTLLVEHFKSSLKFLALHWDQPGQPIVPFLVRKDMLLAHNKEALIALLHSLQTGICGSIIIKTGAMRQLLNSASVERIDDIGGLKLYDESLSLHRQVECKASSKNKPLRPLALEELQELQNSDDERLIDLLRASDDRSRQAHAFIQLWQRKGAEFTILMDEEIVSLEKIAALLYESAATCHSWGIVRRIADITGKYDYRLEDVLLDIVVRQKRLAVGRAYCEEATFSKPANSSSIVKTIKEFCGNNAAESVLTQELIIYIGYLIRTEPELFENMLTLRTWYFVHLLVSQIASQNDTYIGEAYELLLCMAPHEIYDRLRLILSSFNQEVSNFTQQENLQAMGIENLHSIETSSLQTQFAAPQDWAKWRQERGMVMILAPSFYKDIWYLLQRCHALVIGDKYNIQSRIGAELTLDSTAGERNFALHIDTLLQNIGAPDYRQLNIEAIESMTRLFRGNPTLKVNDDIVLDILIGHAVRIAWSTNHSMETYGEERGQAWRAFYALSLQEANHAFSEALIYLLRPEEG